MTEQYTMTISLNVLNHLGLNLYSNVPAVLSEVVANSYDADATRVDIALDPTAGRVVIEDDGHGMTRQEVNDRFLNVGYRRREEGEASTPTYGRAVMGRKGIGKLSLFSIANSVEVHTVKEGERSAFRMSVPAIRAALQGEVAGHGSQYHPEVLDDALADMEHGTRIILSDLKKGIGGAGPALRTRLARRFSILGAEHHFQLFIGGREVTVADRDYFHKLQYLWTYEDDATATEIVARATSQEYEEKRGIQTLGAVRDVEAVAGNGGQVDEPERVALHVRGWIGTASKVSALRDAVTHDNLNKVSLVMRGKVAHEDLLEEFNENGIYASYLIGELSVDGLDADDGDDVATSSRQRIVEDDPRFVLLKTWLQGEITRIGGMWTSLRNDKGVATALDNPVIQEWFSTLTGNTRRKAKSLFGKINQLTVDNDDERRALFAQAVLGFETLRYRDNLDALDDLQPEDIAAATSLFQDISDIEGALYHQIVQQRLEVIEKLSSHLDENVLEKLLQDHLYENLWLLDPGWERATERKKEERIGRTFADIDRQLTEDERNGRMDIRYKRTGGVNVIVELKRASVVISAGQIMDQVTKYQTAVRKHLNEIGSSEALEVVVVVGRDPRGWDDSTVRTQDVQALAQKGIRVVHYEKLLADAQAGYREYLDAQYELGRVHKLLMQLAESVDGGERTEANESESGEDLVISVRDDGHAAELTQAPFRIEDGS